MGEGQPANNQWLTMYCGDVLPHEPPNIVDQSLVINSLKPFTISCKFELGGLLALGLIDLMAKAPGTDFEVRYSYESMGDGPEGHFLPRLVPAVSGKTSYSGADTTVAVPQGTLPDGTYRLTAAVRVIHPLLGWIIGFEEGPIIQVYTSNVV